MILAGGRARRLGGLDKPSLRIGGVPLLHRVLVAVADAKPRIVVGRPSSPSPAAVRWTRELPAGGGPVAATAAGLAELPSEVDFVALLAADLPFLTGEAVRALRRAAANTGYEGAVYEDPTGRSQWLCGVWRVGALRARLAALPGGVHGASLRSLLADAAVNRLRHSPQPLDPPAWFDCDTTQDVAQATRWAHDRRPGG